MLSAVEYGRCEALDLWKNIFLRLYMAAACDSSLLIAETADVYDRHSGVIVKKGLKANGQFLLIFCSCHFRPEI